MSNMIHFSISLAEKIGYEAAILYSFLCEESRKFCINNQCAIAQISIDSICEGLPFWGQKKIIRILKVLANYDYIYPKYDSNVTLKEKGV